jgi:tetratricopeptide (TPR) repeat protein
MKTDAPIKFSDYFEPSSGILEEIAALGLLVKDTDSSVIAFALYRDVASREIAVEALKERLNLPVAEFSLSSRQKNPLKFLQEIPFKGRGCLLFYGLEDALPEAAGFLNLQRETFSEIPHAVIFWVSEYGLRELANKAPDFWAWRSAVFDFRTKSALPFFAIKALASLPLDISDQRNLEQRILLYNELLKEYTHQAKPDKNFLSRLNLKLGIAYYCLRQFEQGKVYFQEVLEQSRSIRNNYLHAYALLGLGLISSEEYQLEEAKSFLKKAYDIFEKFHDSEGLACTYHNLGIVAQDLGQLEEANSLYHKSLEIKEDLGSDQSTAYTYHQLATISFMRNKLDESEQWFRKSLEVFERLGIEDELADEYHGLGMISQNRNQIEQAEIWYHKALDIWIKFRKEHDAAPTYYQLGMICQQQRKFDEAENYYLKSLEIAERSWHKRFTVRPLYQLGYMYLEQGKISDSLSYLGRALPLANKYELSQEKILFALALSLKVMGKKHFLAAWHQVFPDQDPPLEALQLIRKKLKKLKLNN